LMPLRPLTREQAWLLPPSLDDLLPEEHPARFVAAFVDGLSPATLAELEINREGEARGAPSYHPFGLLAVWLYGFMTGVRSSRKLEAACHDQIPLLWLTGCQRPDHNTLWRFYRSHRAAMRRLLKETVTVAVDIGYVDLALQAVDGTKVGANASADRTYDAAGLARLMERTELAIAALEAQNEGSDDEQPSPMPPDLRRAHSLRERVRAAQERLASQEQPTKVNLTDGDARFMKGRQGIIPGYNAQAMASPVKAAAATRPGLLITATDVVTAPTDYHQLAPMLSEAEAMTGGRAETTLADGGYHTAANLETGDQRGQTLVMSERYGESVRGPYFKDRFVYDETTDSYQCPEGKALPFRSIVKTKGGAAIRLYRASRVDCRACPALGICTKDKHTGRALWIGAADLLLRRHREWMETDEARALYNRRKTLIEPVFGILKEQMGGRRFLLRGLANVRAEFALLAVAFNLRTLWRFWLAGLSTTPFTAQG
jgi:transposase